MVIGIKRIGSRFEGSILCSCGSTSSGSLNEVVGEDVRRLTPPKPDLSAGLQLGVPKQRPRGPWWIRPSVGYGACSELWGGAAQRLQAIQRTGDPLPELSTGRVFGTGRCRRKPLLLCSSAPLPCSGPVRVSARLQSQPDRRWRRPFGRSVARLANAELDYCRDSGTAVSSPYLRPLPGPDRAVVRSFEQSHPTAMTAPA